MKVWRGPWGGTVSGNANEDREGLQEHKMTWRRKAERDGRDNRNRREGGIR